MDTLSLGIAIPSYGNAAYIAHALRSVAALTIPFEAVVQDGGSPPEVLRTIDRTLRDDPRFIVRSESDAGQSDAINRAWMHLRQRHGALTWVNTDDIVHPVGLAAALRRLTVTPRAALVYGDYLVIDAGGHVVDFIRQPRRVSRAQLTYNECLVPGVAPLVRTAALESVGMMDTALRYALDHDLFIRLASVGTLVRTPHVVASFRRHESSKTGGTTAAESLVEARVVQRRYQRAPRPIRPPVNWVLRARVRSLRLIGERGAIGPSANAGSVIE